MDNLVLHLKAKLAACVGIAVVCALSFSCANDSNNSSGGKVVSTVPSPNGEYAATIYIVSGGGAAGVRAAGGNQ